jgi:hypothetical protein
MDGIEEIPNQRCMASLRWEIAEAVRRIAGERRTESQERGGEAG